MTNETHNESSQNLSAGPDGDLFSQFETEATKQFWDDIQPHWLKPPIPQSIYHYTDISAAISIIENQEIWTSNISFLNDYHEIQTAQNILSHLPDIGDRISKSEDKKDFCRILIDFVSQRRYYFSFIVSFCEEGDLLSQWRGYGGGMSLEFSTRDFVGRFSDTNVYRVVYDQETQFHIFDSLVNSLFEWTHQVTENIENRLEYAKVAFTTYFEHFSCCMKNYSFREENEWRLITRREMILPMKENPEILFRQINNQIVPYLKLRCETPLPIIGCVTSPMADQSTLYAISALFTKNGYQNSRIRKSEIPLRP